MKIELVDDFDRISKRYSVKIIKIGTALSAAWLALTAVGLTSSIPPLVTQIITTLVFAGAFLAAYLHQPILSEKKDDQ